MNNYLASIALGFLWAMGTSACFAESIYIHSSSPSKPQSESGLVYEFTVKDALEMQTSNMSTTTNWTEMSDFRGVLINDVLNKFNLSGSKLHFRCLDGYSYEIPMSDVYRYNLLLAYERDGVRMSVDTLGPFALIYPRSSFKSELNTPETDAKFIWMIKDIFIE